MAGIADPNTIDVVAQEADGTYVLVMVEERRWGSDPQQTTQLMAKINTYAAYVLEGGLARMYEETDGRPVKIRLDCTDPPTGQLAQVVDHATQQLAGFGLEFVVNPSNRG